MPDLWGFILGSSTLDDVPENDLWDHLNNLGAGEAGGFVLVSTLEVEVMSDCIDVEIIDDTIDVEIVCCDLDVEILDDTIEVEIDCG